MLTVEVYELGDVPGAGEMVDGEIWAARSDDSMFELGMLTCAPWFPILCDFSRFQRKHDKHYETCIV